MGYPIYKLIRAVNRQYPNNGFINYVDVTESIYNNENPDLDGVIDEDLRDIINEAIQENYINIARDEVYSFPTVPGQREYSLPDDCDLRDIQEVTRTFASRGWHGHGIQGETITHRIFFFNGEGTGTMDPVEVEEGEYVLPECIFTPPTGHTFSSWLVGDVNYQPGDTISVYTDLTITAIFEKLEFEVSFSVNPLKGNIGGESTVSYMVEYGDTIESLPTVTAESGFTFDGWSTDGETVIPNATVLATPVTEDIVYEGLFEIDTQYYNISIYIMTEGGTGILHYMEAGSATEQTLTMTYGGNTFDFQVEAGQSIGSVYTILEMHDSSDNYLVSFTGMTPTGDQNIPVAVPVIGNDTTEPAEPTDPGRDPESEEPVESNPLEDDSGSSGDSGSSATPSDGGRDPEDSDDDSGTVSGNPLG